MIAYFLFYRWRRVPGDQCNNDLQEKLYKLEDCQDPSPGPDKQPEVKLELLNKTRAAVIGEGLQFSVNLFSHFSKISANPACIVWNRARSAEIGHAS